LQVQTVIENRRNGQDMKRKDEELKN
jgi:hypothetical protein